jgi:hypothetical protein
VNACGHAEPGTGESKARYQRQFAAGWGAPPASAKGSGRSPVWLIDESIPETDDRLDLPAGLAKLAPQASDVNVD